MQFDPAQLIVIIGAVLTALLGREGVLYVRSRIANRGAAQPPTWTETTGEHLRPVSHGECLRRHEGLKEDLERERVELKELRTAITSLNTTIAALPGEFKDAVVKAIDRHEDRLHT